MSALDSVTDIEWENIQALLASQREQIEALKKEVAKQDDVIDTYQVTIEELEQREREQNEPYNPFARENQEREED